MRPNHVTADRLDRVTVGQLVHIDPFALTDAVPDDDWLEVTGVQAGNGQVLLSLSDETTFATSGDRLVRIGWNN